MKEILMKRVISMGRESWLDLRESLLETLKKELNTDKELINL